MPQITEQHRREIGERLVEWFKKNQRDLPWRKTYDPYQVWISEIMLQQTQVKTALPYFERWVKALPDIASVARAKEDKILKLWEGLGYYSRARNLQKAAKGIVKNHKGIFPGQFEDILDLPGIGRYSAGAIASIAFNQERPVVDGNVIRVLARLFGFTENTRLPKNTAKFWEWAEGFIPKGNARDFNQGMMELGALVCAPKSPDCDRCPLKKLCVAHQKNIQGELPNRGNGIKAIQIKTTLAVIRKGGKIFIQKRPNHGLMGGLWEFPGGKVLIGENEKGAITREIAEELGITIRNVKRICRIRHGYTKFDVDLHCFSADFGTGKIRLKAATQGKWVSQKMLSRFAFPAANRKLIGRLIQQ